GDSATQLKTGIYERAVMANMRSGTLQAGHALNAPLGNEILRLGDVTACPHQSGAERAGLDLMSPFDTPVLPTSICYIDLRARTTEVLFDETKRGLWLPLHPTSTIFKIEQRRIHRVHP